MKDKIRRIFHTQHRYR